MNEFVIGSGLMGLFFLFWGLNGIFKREIPLPSKNAAHEPKIFGTIAFILGFPLTIWGVLLTITAVQWYQKIPGLLDRLAIFVRLDFRNGNFLLMFGGSFILFFVVVFIGLFTARERFS
jgi:hypothetical protein